MFILTIDKKKLFLVIYSDRPTASFRVTCIILKDICQILFRIQSSFRPQTDKALTLTIVYERGCVYQQTFARTKWQPWQDL